MGLTDRIFSYFGLAGPSEAPQGELRNLQNPNTPITEGALLQLLGGGATSSGVSVNEFSSLNAPIVHACVQVICQEIASLPVFIYRSLERGRQKAEDHPLYKMLLYSPNPEMTSYRFRYLMQQHLLLWGNAFAEIVRDKRGNVVELWPLPPDRTVAFRTNQGNIKVKTRTPHGDVLFDREQVFHLKNFPAPDGINGISTIQRFRQSIGLSIALDEFGAGYFGKGLNPGGFIKLDKSFTKKEERDIFRESMESMMAGLKNAHRLGVLEAGMSFEPSAIKPNDSQFIESKKFQAIDIARIFRVPPHKVGITEASNKATVEQAALEIYTDTLRPQLENWEQEIMFALFNPADLGKYHVSFYMDGILRGDSEARHKNYAAGRQWGYFSINDVREMEGLNPIDGGDGYQLPLNMVDALQKTLLANQEPNVDPALPSDLGNRSIKLDIAGRELAIEAKEIRAAKVRVQKRSVEERNRLTEAFLGVFKRAADNVSRYENKALAKLLSDSTDLESFLNDLPDVYDRLPDVIKREFSPVFSSFASALQGVISEEIASGDPTDTILSPELQQFLSEYGDSLTNRWVRSSQGQLTELADAEEAEIQDIEDRIDEWGQTRAEKVARNESVRLNGAIARALYTFFGVSTIVWVTSAKPCPICVTLEGQEIETTGYFVKEGGEVDPGDGETTPLQTRTKIGHPPLHEGCTCSIAAG